MQRMIPQHRFRDTADEQRNDRTGGPRKGGGRLTRLRSCRLRPVAHVSLQWLCRRCCTRDVGPSFCAARLGGGRRLFKTNLNFFFPTRGHLVRPNIQDAASPVRRGSSAAKIDYSRTARGLLIFILFFINFYYAQVSF